MWLRNKTVIQFYVSFLTLMILNAKELERPSDQNVRLARQYGPQASMVGIQAQPGIEGEFSDLFIKDLVIDPIHSSRLDAISAGDVFVIQFDLVEAFPDWVPVPNEIDTCEFENGSVTCARISDTAISLTLDEDMLQLNGLVGKVQNIPTTQTGQDFKSLFTVNRIDYYSKHSNELSDDFVQVEVPTDTTFHDMEFTIDICRGVIEDAQLSISASKVGQVGEESTLNLSFNPITELDEGAWIQIDIPFLYPSYDQTTQTLKFTYPNQQEGFKCTSDIIGKFNISQSSPGKIRLNSDFIKSLSDQMINITCTYWMAPISSSKQFGYFVKTFNQEGYLLDKSPELFIDASDLEPALIQNSDVDASLSVPALNQMSQYTFQFTIPLPIDPTGECFVKYMFPPEIDITGLDLDNIQGKGLFVERQGSIQRYRERYLVNQYNLEEGWIILNGCEFYPIQLSQQSFEFYQERMFSVTFKNILNPSQDNVSEMKFQVFKSQNVRTKELSGIIAETKGFVKSPSLYVIEIGQIDDAQIVSKGKQVAQVEGNEVDITFTTDNDLDSESGKIRIEVPIWAIIYDKETNMKRIEYMHGHPSLDCSSDQFESLNIKDSDDESSLELQYTVYKRNRRRLIEDNELTRADSEEPSSASQPDTIKITCKNWRNPIVPKEISGFQLLTIDKDGDRPLDFSNQFSLDGSRLSPSTIDNSTFFVEVREPFPLEPTDYTIQFEAGTHIDSNEGCYVKYTFPQEIDISQVDQTAIIGRGMFVDTDGNVKTFSHIDIKSGDGWIALKGCQMDLDEKSVDELINWNQNVFKVTFKDVINPQALQDTSFMTIEIFLSWSDDNDEGLFLISKTDSVFIPQSTFFYPKGVITDPMIVLNSQQIGEIEDVMATISFTIATSLQQSGGSIQILTPEIGRFYDDNEPRELRNKMKPMYLIDRIEKNSCQSEQLFRMEAYLENTTSLIDRGLWLTLTYESVIDETTLPQITIVCNNWISPIKPVRLDKFRILTKTLSGDKIDDSYLFQFDATSFFPYQIPSSSFVFNTSSKFLSDYSNHTLEFDISLPIEYLGCFVKYTFPQQIDISKVDFQKIEGWGLLGAPDGSINSFSNYSAFAGDNWIVLHGCHFDPIGSHLENFDQSSLKKVFASFKNIQNPIEAIGNDSILSVQIYKDWDFIESNKGQTLLAEIQDFFIPNSAFVLSGGSADILLSKPLAGFVSNYSISFKPEIQMEPSEGCFVKYTFPPQVDAKYIIIDDIEAKGLFSNEIGQIFTIDPSKVVTSLSQEGSQQWIAVPGCQFDTTENFEEDIRNFVDNRFEITFQNVSNPTEAEYSSELLIQVYKSWNEETQIFETLLAQSNDFRILEENFILNGGTISESSISVSKQILGVGNNNVATISFSSFSELPTNGKIVIETPIWSSARFDIESQKFIDEYFFDQGVMSCQSDSFEVFEYNVYKQFLKISYQGSVSPSDPIVIECLNWKNPNLPQILSGFSILTFETSQKYALDFTGENMQIDATSFDPVEIQNDQISYRLSHQHANELSDYTIEFETDILIDAQDGCFVKYTFPPELDATTIDLDDIHGSWMLVDSTGVEQIISRSHVMSNLKHGTDELKWITVSGCHVSFLGKSEQQLKDFEQNKFKVVFHNVLNPPIKEDTSIMKIEVFKSWDSTNNVGVDKLAQASSFFFPQRVFDIQGGLITEIQISSSSEYLGTFEQIDVTISFTPATSLPIQKGAIELSTPQWGRIYDGQLGQAIISYPNSDITTCTSSSFTVVDLHESKDNILHIDYIDLVGEDNEAVSFTCKGWKNPLLRGETSGFSLKTLDSAEYQIDEAENFSFDGASLKKAPIGMNEIDLTTFVSLSGYLDGLKLRFKSGVNLESNDGCFVKFKIPLSINFTQKSLETIKTSGMLVGSDGNKQTLSQEKIYSNIGDKERTATWFALEGCQFDTTDRQSVKDFEQDVFDLEILGFQGFKITQEVQPLRIQIYKYWDTNINDGQMLLSDSGTFQLPTEALTSTFEGNPLQIDETLITTIRMEGTLQEFQNSNGEEQFVQNIAEALDIEESQIEVSSVTEGSVVVTYEINTDSQEEVTASDLKSTQDKGLESGQIDVGANILEYQSEVQSTVIQPTSGFVAPEQGQSSHQVSPVIIRQLDPFDKNDNCMFCHAQNENIQKQGENGYIYTVFCELPDYTDSKCCQVQYDSQGNLNFYGESRFDTVCIYGETAGLCSMQKVQNSPNIKNYFQMYGYCLVMGQRSTTEINEDYTQFKGQGQESSICGESPSLSFSSDMQQYEYYKFEGQKESSPEFLCKIDILSGQGSASSLYALEYRSNGDPSNNNRFYFVYRGYGNEYSLTELSESEQFTLSLTDSNRYKLLSVFDVSNQNVNTKVRFGLEVERVKCMVRFEYDGGYAKYVTDGGQSKFKTDIASVVGVDENYFDVATIYEGSITAEYYIQRDQSSELSLEELYKIHNNSIEVGEFEPTIGGLILEFDPGYLPIDEQPSSSRSEPMSPEGNGDKTIIIIIYTCVLLLLSLAIGTAIFVKKKLKQKQQTQKIAQIIDESASMDKQEDTERSRTIFFQEDATYKPVTHSTFPLSAPPEFNQNDSNIYKQNSALDTEDVNRTLADQDFQKKDLTLNQSQQTAYLEEIEEQRRYLASRQSTGNQRLRIESRLGRTGFSIEVESIKEFSQDGRRRKIFDVQEQMEILQQKKKLRQDNHYLD